MPTMLSVHELNQYYGGSHILRGVSFEAKLGEVTVVLGRNGVGKTTLLRSLMGVVPVRSGRLQLGEVDITRARPSSVSRAVWATCRRGARSSTGSPSERTS